MPFRMGVNLASRQNPSPLQSTNSSAETAPCGTTAAAISQWLITCRSQALCGSAGLSATTKNSSAVPGQNSPVTHARALRISASVRSSYSLRMISASAGVASIRSINEFLRCQYYRNRPEIAARPVSGEDGAARLCRLQRLLAALLRGLFCRWLCRRLRNLLGGFFLQHRPMRRRSRQRRRVANPLRITARHCTLRRCCALGSPPLRRNLFLCRFFLIRTLQKNPRPEDLLHQIRAAALRALLRHRLVIRGKVALRIIRATPEDIAPACLALSQVARAALGTLESFNDVLLHVLALGIPGAGDELPITSLAQHQRLAALRAVFARGLRRGHLLLLLAAQLAEGFAGRVLVESRARHEHPEWPAPQHHHPPALIAVLLLLTRLLSLGRVHVRLARRVFFGKCAARLIFLVVRGTGKKAAELAPLQQQRRPAQIAFFVRLMLHALDVFHLLAGVLQLLFKVAVESFQQVRPLLVTLFNLVQFLFQLGRVRHVEDIRKVLYQ